MLVELWNCSVFFLLLFTGFLFCSSFCVLFAGFDIGPVGFCPDLLLGAFLITVVFYESDGCPYFLHA